MVVGMVDRLQRVLTWWFARPAWVRDTALAVLLTVVTQVELSLVAVEGSMVQQRLSFALMTLAVAGRRRVPLVAAAVLSVGMVIQTLAGTAPVVGGFVAMLIITYSLGAHASGWVSTAGLGLVLVGVHVYPLVEPDRVDLADEVGNLAIFVGVWALGHMIRRRESRADRLHDRAVAAETDREQRLRAALEHERARIAGELHDLVAHGVSVMVLQAGAARQAFDRDPRRAREALSAIESTGRQALEEMHRLLGLLRRSDDGIAEVEPPATLDGLERLLDHVRAAGLDAEVHIDGDRRRLSPGLELSAYRIIQESLTNTVKHAHASRVDVRLEYRPESLHVEVSNDGEPGDNGDQGRLAGAGHGTLSMRERVLMFGGDLELGPRPEGGWHVTAHLPTAAGS